MVLSFFEKPYIICSNQSQRRYLPIVGMSYASKYDSNNAISCDIACNIIPVLKKNNVKVLAVRDPESEWDKIADIVPYNIKNKGSVFSHPQRKTFFKFLDAESEQIENELRSITSVFQKGILQLKDQNGKYMNIVDGERYTCGNSNSSPNTIFFFGPCLVWGNLVEDKCTVCSYLKKDVPDSYFVRNCGSGGSAHYIMRSKRYKPGDIVIVMAYNKNIYDIFGVKTHSILNAYRNTPDVQSCVWDSPLHINKIVMKNVADEVYQICVNEHFFDTDNDIIQSNSIKNTIRFGLEQQSVPEELSGWLRTVSGKYKKANKAKLVQLS